MDQQGSAAMLISIQSASVAPEVNHTGEKAHKGCILALKPRETSTEVQNTGISGSIKMTYVLQKNLKTTKKNNCMLH